MYDIFFFLINRRKPTGLQYVAKSWQDAQRRVVHAYRQWLRSVSHERQLSLHPGTDSTWHVRLLKFSRCIHSIYPCLNYEQKYGRNLKDIDMSTSWGLWTCCCSKVIRSFRYTASLADNTGASYWGLSTRDIPPGRTLTQHITGNIELLEANTTRDEIFSGNRKSNSKITCKFHARLPGGRSCECSSKDPR